MSDTSFILTDNSLTLFHDSQIHTVSSAHSAWDAILDAVRVEDWDAAIELAKPVNAIRRFTEGSPVTISGTTVLYQGEPVHGSLVDRILALNEGGFNISPMVKFLENLMQNPSYRSREQLYTFLENNQMPITQDGCFMAYKRVNADFTDLHSGKFDNHPGRVVEMPRQQVDDDPTRTCSAGLHVCSQEYLKSFGGAKLVACKVNPADVVSVPVDYNFTKMRVAKYTVVEELPISLVNDATSHWTAPVYDEPDDYSFEDDIDD